MPPWLSPGQARPETGPTGVFAGISSLNQLFTCRYAPKQGSLLVAEPISPAFLSTLHDLYWCEQAKKRTMLVLAIQ